ncbi:DUF397 domain-containing protein [Streptomyces sp. NPDC127072]|uniref:DUF397 domain-containing protein n=1 Tax=Streptomyces sp. NPDC127072 TaxID=3347129 RepID=UPI00366A0B84
MGTGQELLNARWRKSSYSGNTGGECVECATLGAADWRKSSYSSTNGGDCVEVADLTPHIALRDSKSPESGAFKVAPETFAAFTAAAASGAI